MKKSEHTITASCKNYLRTEYKGTNSNTRKKKEKYDTYLILVCITHRNQISLQLSDGNSEYNGRSIDKELLACLDSTKQLVGALTKFRQKEVAFIADI